jgi:uncharacterized membrane protein (UPF0127 family)
MRVKKIIIADTILKRTKGLLGKKKLEDDEGLLLCGCRAVHTMFMRFPISVIFIDKEYQIVGIENNIKPWSKSKYYSDAYYVLEVNASEHDLKSGDKIMGIEEFIMVK